MLFLLLTEFCIVNMVGILVDSDLHATSCVPCDKLVIDEDMTIMAPIGAAPAFRLGVEDAKFKRHFTRVDSQEHVRKEAGGFVCHTFSFLQRNIFRLLNPGRDI